MATRFVNKEKVLRRFRKLPELVKAEVKASFAKSAQDVVDMQKRLAPVDSGALRDSITWNWGAHGKVKYSQGGGPVGGLLTITISAGNAKVRYAHLAEFGVAPHIVGGRFKGAQHPGFGSRPFFYPAYRAKKRAVKARTRRAFKKAIIASKGA